MAHPDNNCALELNYDIWFRVKKFSCLKVCGYESLSRPKNSKSTCTCFLIVPLENSSKTLQHHQISWEISWNRSNLDYSDDILIENGLTRKSQAS